MFLDEIQECPRAITALKLFCEQTPHVPIVAAGSLLGVALSRDAQTRGSEAFNRVSWPVGKVSYLDLHPLTFGEFVRAVETPQFAQLVESGPFEMLDSLNERMTSLLAQYLYVGGMPEAVQTYVDTRDLTAVRTV